MTLWKPTPLTICEVPLVPGRPCTQCGARIKAKYLGSKETVLKIAWDDGAYTYIEHRCLEAFQKDYGEMEIRSCT